MTLEESETREVGSGLQKLMAELEEISQGFKV